MPTSARDQPFKAGLERLGTATLAVGFAGAVAASRVAPPPASNQLDETGRLLNEIRDIARASRPLASDPVIEMHARRIDASTSEIDQLAGIAGWSALRQLAADACLVPAKPAMLLLSTGTTYKGGPGSLYLEIYGRRASLNFSFASATAQVYIIKAINTFTQHLGVSAAVNDVHPERISVCSTEAGTDGFVRIRQSGGGVPIILFLSASPFGVPDAKAWGTDRVTWSAQPSEGAR